MFVVAIIGTLAAIAVPSYLGFVEKARVVRARAEIRGIATVIDAYEVSWGTLPASLADAGQAVTLDPWGKPYLFLKIAGSGPLVDAAPPRPRIAGASPLRVIRVALQEHPSPPDPSPPPSPEPPPVPEPLPAPAPTPPDPGEPPPSPNVTALARKDRFLVPLNSDYDLYSEGKDGESMAPLSAPQSQDDVVRANDGAYIGLASQY